MSETDIQSLKGHLIRTTASSIIGSFLLCVGLWIAFYYNTTNRLFNNEEKISKVTVVQEKQQDKLNSIELKYVESTTIQQQILKEQQEMKVAQKEMNNKIDKVYDILIEIKKK